MGKIGKTISLIFLAILMAVLLFGGISILRYSKWEKEFEANIQEENLSDVVEELPEDIMIKVAKFVGSLDKTDFVEFETKEISTIFHFVLNQTLEGVTFEKVYIVPNEGVWKIYVKGALNDLKIPWVAIELVKDDMETAELYVRNIYLGNFGTPRWISKSLLERINSGISEAVLMFNENLFSKRYIQNISLGEESVVIKGILY